MDEREEVQRLFSKLKASLPELRELLEETSGHWGYEDFVYRLYHHSFKVYGLQDATTKIVAALQELAPEKRLNPWFTQIVKDGTGKTFEPEHNRRWLEVTRPIVEAFFHARYFLEMAVRYGTKLKAPPKTLPSGWAAFSTSTRSGERRVTRRAIPEARRNDVAGRSLKGNHDQEGIDRGGRARPRLTSSRGL